MYLFSERPQLLDGMIYWNNDGGVILCPKGKQTKNTRREDLSYTDTADQFQIKLRGLPPAVYRQQTHISVVPVCFIIFE